DGEHAEQEYRQHEIVDVEWRMQVDEAEQRAARHALDAVLASGERRLHAEEEEHLRQRQRDHREIDALPPYGEEPHDEAEHGRTGDTDQYADLRRQAPDLDGMGGEIGRPPEE